MGARKELSTSVVLRNPGSGEVVILAGGAPLPKWAEELVGDHVLAPLGTAAKAEDRARRDKADARSEARRRRIAEAAGQTESEDDLYDAEDDVDQDPEEEVEDELSGESLEGDAPTEPPRAGRGSGIEAWTRYVEALPIEIPEGASRDDLIELVDQHLDES